LILVSIFILAILVRFYNFPNRVTFWSEQARSLIVAGNYLEEPSLLGQEYFRVNSFGHKLFASALFNYSLVPLLLLSKFDPIPITAYFALLNIFSGFALYYVVLKIFKHKEIAAFSLILFLFNNYMIYHSLFIWILDYLPILGVLLIYLFYNYFKTGRIRFVFLLGIASGLSFGLEYFYLFTAIPILGYIIYRAKKKILSVLIFGLGAILGNLPMVVFDARHDFYHVRTFFQFFMDTLEGNSGGNITYYQFLHLWPLLALLSGYLLFLLYKNNKILAFVALVIYVALNIRSPLVSFKSAVGMPVGMVTQNVDDASKIIAQDANGDFNVAEVLDFDKRAYVFRYYLQFKYDKEPLDEVSYQNPGFLYVLSEKDYNFGKSDVWEINAGGPYKISLLTDVGQGHAVYKMQK